MRFISTDWNTSARIILYPGALFCLLFPQPGIMLGVGLLLFGLEYFCFVRQADRSIDLRILLRMAAILFMWLAPAVSYLSLNEVWYTGYRMPISENIYFALVIPGTVALNLALSLPVGPARIQVFQYAAPMGWWLLGIGFILGEIIPLEEVPAGIRHITFLTTQLWLVGILMLGNAYPARRRVFLIVAFLYLIYTAIQSTLFGYSIIWSVILVCYTLKEGDISFRGRLSATFLLAIGILFLLSFKYEYRQQIWHENRLEPRWRIFLEVAAQRLRHPGDLFRPEIIEHYTDRLNQGYHTAQAMAYVPSHTPFAKGSTLLMDVKSAVMPRFLDPDKHKAGGSEFIRRFSGIDSQQWSSNIGHYGEAYVNFGIGGAWLVLLAYGLFISGIYILLRQYFFFPWWPFVLQPILNVEEDIGMGLNHIAKGLVFAILVAFIFKFIFGRIRSL